METVEILSSHLETDPLKISAPVYFSSYDMMAESRNGGAGGHVHC
jgi:hypothetical protein